MCERGPLMSPRHDLSSVGAQRGERARRELAAAPVCGPQVSRGEIAGAASESADGDGQRVQASCHVQRVFSFRLRNQLPNK